MEDCIGTSCASVEIGKDKYRTEVRAGKHLVLADEPKDAGGTDLGMDPNSFFLAGLGTCTAITLRMYADRKNWAVDRIKVELSLEIVKSEQQLTTYIKRHISIEGQISAEQKERMLQIADHCPMHKLLNNPVIITSNLLP